MPKMYEIFSKTWRLFLAAYPPIDTWSYWLADVEIESAEAGLVSILDSESNAADVSMIMKKFTLYYHVAAVESSIFSKKTWHFRYSLVNISLNSGFTESTDWIECHGDKISSFGDILSMEITATDKPIFSNSIPFGIDKWIISRTVHLFCNQATTESKWLLSCW